MKELIGTVNAIPVNKNQFLLTIPREAVERLGIQKGDKYHVLIDEAGRIYYEKASLVIA
jgi:bifunctional DNA-binding transcriptional regulator/antitoxin component of YhaV-PrlF toxin-antitoxin module